MDKRRIVRYYGFVERSGCLEDFYFFKKEDGINHLKEVVEQSNDLCYGVIMAHDCGIPNDATTWIIIPGEPTLSLELVKQEHGCIDNYVSFLFNDRPQLEEINWIKEGF